MRELLTRLGLSPVNSGAWMDGPWETTGREVASFDPATGEEIARVRLATRADWERMAQRSGEVFARWSQVPAPQRGEIVRQMGLALREHKEDLGRLVTWEVGKILSEGLGEVQEGIDIADFAVGLSRQLYGLTMPSERPSHRMYEQWHPLGMVAVITAFNFPHAVWAWNAMLGAVCGDTIIWKPSIKAPLTAIATHRVCEGVLAKAGFAGVFALILGEDAEVGEAIVRDRRVPLVSATGSCRMGRKVGAIVAERLGRSLLELGGNNAVIVNKDADLEMALRAVLFGAFGTAGQRCTTTRRLLVHEDVAEAFTDKLVAATGRLPWGNPQETGVLVGPLIDEDAVRGFEHAVATAVSQGGKVRVGGKRRDGAGSFVEPTLIESAVDLPVAREETFAPILYVMRFSNLEEAIRVQNGVDQGLSSSIFTDSFREAERFLGPRGSDCGIANVNIGTSGAEIGGAFGGEKDTGGGRESGSDSWKAYMRRQTCTLNWGTALPLAQGVKFDV